METANSHSSPESQPAPAKRGRTCLVAALVVAVVLTVLCAGLCGGAFFVFVWGIKNLDPYEMALEQVRSSEQVTERLGEPIKDASWVPTGQVNVTNDQGSGTLAFKVRGPRGEANVRAQARLVDGIWGLTEVEVTFADGQSIFLETGGDGIGDAPAWNPPDEAAEFPVQSDAPPEIEMELPADVP